MKQKVKRFSKAEWSWILYDWANSAWATNIAAAIFPIYFAMKATEAGNAIYGYVVSIANLTVAVLAPLLGAIGDFYGMKKKFWNLFLILGVAATAMIGIFGNWQMMLIGFVISRVGFSGANLFYDSFLTDVTVPERMDKVSSWGFAMGYIGGSTIPFVASIVIMYLMGMSELSYRIGILIVPVWWLLFSIPFMKNVKQVHYVDKRPSALIRESLQNVLSTTKAIFTNRAILFFILAYFFYIDGVDTIISLATNYGSALGLGTIGMILALMVTQIIAVPGSILFGNLSRKIGAYRMLLGAVCVYLVVTLVGFAMGFIIDFNDTLGLTTAQALSISTILFWILACLEGTVQGGIQAISRSYYGQLIPAERSSEYYGFLDIFGKFSCIIGPALYALIRNLTGKASFGILSTILLFIGGMIFMLIGKPYFKAIEHEAVNE